MRSSWISQTNSSKLIIFFAGWGMNGTEVSHLDPSEFDIICFYDYRDFKDLPEIDKSYKEVYIVAWSFGVACAESVLRELNLPKLTKKIAINGTLKPIDREFGIPSEIFQGTLESYSLETREKFLRRTCGSKSGFEFFIDQAELRDANEQSDELEKLGRFFNKTTNCLIFTTAVIGTRDRIIPFENQQRFWETTSTEIVKIAGAAHYPFQLWKSWQEIIDL